VPRVLAWKWNKTGKQTKRRRKNSSPEKARLPAPNPAIPPLIATPKKRGVSKGHRLTTFAPKVIIFPQRKKSWGEKIGVWQKAS